MIKINIQKKYTLIELENEIKKLQNDLETKQYLDRKEILHIVALLIEEIKKLKAK